MTSSPFTIENNVLKGEVVPYQEDYAGLGEFILSRIKDRSDLVGQIDVVTGKSYTYRTMRERSVRCALWLQSKGLRPRDVVALCTNDHLDYPMACWAVLYLGAIPAPCTVPLPEEELLSRMKITRPKVAFATEVSAPAVAEVAKKLKLDLKIVAFGRVPGFLEFERIIAEPGADEVERFSCVLIESPVETAFIVFSSGTTGQPKGVEMSHKALAMLACQGDTTGMSGNVCLTFASTDWLTSVDSMLTSLMLTMPRLILSAFDEHSACAAIERYKVTWLEVTPILISKLLKSDAVGKYDLSSLTEVLYSGSALSTESYKAFKKLLPNVKITSCYGMTEACGSISIQSGKSRPGSCGEIMENAQLKVIDPVTGRTLGANQKGELLLKFVCMMNGYLDDPRATSKAIDEDGWLHSGDFGYYDELGEIFVVDRLKDMIRLGDFAISPSHIEGVIWSHPGVKEAAVVGQTLPREDDVLIAFVVRAKDSTNTSKQVTEGDIVNVVVAELPDNRRFRVSVRFVDHIPKTPSNKIRRAVLRNLARSMVTLPDHASKL